MAADPSVIVWLEGSEPVSSDGDVVFSRYDLYRAPFTTDPALLEPELLVAEFRPNLTSYLGLGRFSLENGHLAFTYTVGLPVEKRDALVVRLADGRAWRARLPDDYQWGNWVFAGPDELWGAANKGTVVGAAEAIIRIPYTEMELLQTAPPGAAGGQ
jgi:hypothetical protein